MKHQPTEAQKAEAAAKRQKFYDLVGKVAAMTDEQRQALADRIMVTTCEGHPLSAFNNVLVASQFEAATIVGGFNQWIKAGRSVRKGEHGIAIYAPRNPAKSNEAIRDNDKDREVHFIMVYVFDVSQTEPLAQAQG